MAVSSVLSIYIFATYTLIGWFEVIISSPSVSVVDETWDNSLSMEAPVWIIEDVGEEGHVRFPLIAVKWCEASTVS